MHNFNLDNIYRFSYTLSALQSGNEVMIGAGLNNAIHLDFSSTPRSVIDALALINGQLSVAEILDKRQLQSEEKEDFFALIDILLDHKVVELAGAKEMAKAQEAIDGIDYERFDRQINLFKHTQGDFLQAIETQNKLAELRIAIVGLGGCGSYVFYTLSAMGIGHMNCYEFDIVEKSNLSRQVLYNYDDIGRKKIEVAEEKGKKISPTTHFTFYDQKIETLEDAKQVFTDVDLVICAADIPRPGFFKLMNKAAYDVGVPLLYAGSCTNNAVIGPLVIPGQTRCYECINKMENTGEDFPFVQQIQDQYYTTLIDPYNAVAGSLSALEAVKYLTGFDECQIIEKTMFIDFSGYQIDKEAEIYTGHCDVCMHVANIA